MSRARFITGTPRFKSACSTMRRRSLRRRPRSRRASRRRGQILGSLNLRLGELDPAAQAIDRAAQLGRRTARSHFFRDSWKSDAAVPMRRSRRFRRAVDLNPTGLRVRYALAQEIEAAGGQNADAQAEELLDQLVRLSPDNVAAVLERARVAAKRSDGRVLQESVASLEKRVDGWPAVAVEQYRALQRAATASDFPEAARSVAVLRNVLLRVPAFREDLLAIRTPAELIADPFDHFLTLPASTSKPSPADLNLTFTQESVGPAAPSSAVLSFSSNGTDRPAVFAADAREVRRLTAPAVALPLPAEMRVCRHPPARCSPIDWNRDFRMDLVLAGAGGVRLFLQGADGTFRDATADAAGSSEALNADSFGAWTADLEMDGDLDIIVGVNGGPPVALRNNGDGTWRRLQPFGGVTGLRAFAWGDLDRDGDPGCRFARRARQPASLRKPPGRSVRFDDGTDRRRPRRRAHRRRREWRWCHRSDPARRQGNDPPCLS